MRCLSPFVGRFARSSTGDWQSQLPMLLGPIGGQIGEARDSEAAGQGSVRRGFDNVWREESERENHARRTQRDILACGDSLDIGDGPFRDVGEPAPRFGDGGEELVSRLSTKRLCVTSAVDRLNDFALSEECLRRPGDDKRIGLIAAGDDVVLDPQNFDGLVADDDTFDCAFYARAAGLRGPAQDWGWARQRGIFRVCSLTEVDAWPGF
jgi:hypothetical protein